MPSSRTLHEDFVRAHTTVLAPAFVPELRLHLATEITPLWTATEAFLKLHDIEPPYWAFAWPGGLALARWMLDAPERFAGRRLLDFAAGSGIAAIAAARVGARALAVEIDPMAEVAIHANAALNEVEVETRTADLAGADPPAVDLLVAGDVCYSRPMVDRILPFFRRCAAAGIEVVIADPGRAYVPADGIEEVADYEVPVLRELEDRDHKRTRLIRLRCDAA